MRGPARRGQRAKLEGLTERAMACDLRSSERYERLQAERLQQVAEVVASASEEELVEIEGKVAARRTELRQIKHEL